MKKLLTLFFTFTFFFVYSTLSLNLGSPVQVAYDSSLSAQICCPIAQTNKFNEMLVIWTDSTNALLGSFSKDNGVTWSTSVMTIPATSLSYPFLASNDHGFLLTFVDSVSNIPSSIFYDSSSGLWDSEVSIDASISANIPVFVTTTPQGFLATFMDGGGNGYANLSTDGLTWQPSSKVLFTSADSFSVSSISGCGNRSLLLTTWADYSTGNIYVSTSTNGVTWNTPTVISSNSHTGSGDNTSSGCFANKEGFLIGYIANTSLTWDILSLFSSDGSNWTANSTPIGSSAGIQRLVPQISGNDSGFVTSWVAYADPPAYTIVNAYASFSPDGKNWQTPVQFSAPRGAFNPVPLYYFGTVVQVHNDRCLFSWNDANGNIYVSTSSFPYTPPTPPTPSGSTSVLEKKWGFTAPVTPNRPGRQF